MSTPWLDSNNVNEMIINKSSKTEFHTHTFHLKWSRRFVYRKPINFPRKMTVNEINTLWVKRNACLNRQKLKPSI